MFDRVNLESGTRHPHALGKDLAQQARVVVTLDGDDETVVGPGAGCLHAKVSQYPLHLPEVNAQSDDFDEPAAAPHDFVDSCRVLPGEVAGAELGDAPALSEVLGGLGVAEHDVGACVDELAMLQAGNGVEAECASGDGDADGAGDRGREFRRQVCHPGGGLRLAVHHEQIPALAAAESGVVLHHLRCEPAAGLGDVAQAGQIHVREPHTFQQLEGVGNGRE